MRSTPHPGSATAVRVGRRLLLLLALAACGEKSQGGNPSDTPPGQSDTRVANKGKAPPNCAPSPAIDPALLNDTVSWSVLAAWRDTMKVSFRDSLRDSTVARVPLCDTGCAPVTLQIVSEARTYCNTPDSMRNTTRIAGVWVVQEGTVDPPGWNHTFRPGDSIFVFARDTSSEAQLAYKVGDNVHMAPANAWRYAYCQDGHRPNAPQGRWRINKPERAVAMPRDTVGNPDPGTYGWMACASGCCQFYIPPGQNKDRGRRPDCAQRR